MIEGLNVNSLNVDDKGRVSFSGLGSGIDFQGTVDKIIAAKRIPVDSLETRVQENTDKITALKELRTNLEALQTSLSKLYGAVSFGNASDIFQNKQAFASDSRVDGATPSAVANLVGVSVTNAAATGSHSIEILRAAKAHKVSSDAYASTSSTLGFTNGDSFTVEGVTITVTSSDTLQDLRDRINSANTGTNATGVTASIVSVGTAENYLLLTKDATGTAMTLADSSGTPLADVGILTGAGAIKNQLQAAQTAQLYADGLLDQTNTIYESDFQSASTVQVGSAGTLQFTRDSDSANLGSVTYAATDTLQDLATAITAGVTGVTASVVTDGAGVRLEITGSSGFSIAETGAGTAITDLGIDNKRKVIERNSNTISDLFNGVTLTLFQAEAGTTIKLDIEQDLSQVKTEITNFVTAYNTVRTLINSHRLTDKTTGAKDENAGVLFSSAALAEVDETLSQLLGKGTTGVSQNFQVLAQIGVKFIDLNVDDPLTADTLVIDESKLDEVLLNNPNDVRKLFTFDFTASDPRVSLLGFDGNTTYNATGYTLNLQPASGDNLLQYSEQADNAVWSKVRSTVTADAAIAPDGSTTADALVADTTNNTHYLTNATGISVTAGQTYVFSTYAKAGDKTGARITMGGAGFGKAIRANFDLSTGTISSVDPGAEEATIEDVGSGWYRLSIKATATASSTAFFERYARDGGAISFAGDGTTANTYFWGAQLEQASTNSTVLDDTGLTPTRATISANVATPTAPDGTTTADGLIADTTNNSHFVSNTAGINVTAGQQYDFVTYVQAGARSKVRLILNGSNFAANTTADFDLSAGTNTATGSGTDSAKIESAGAGWYRVTLTATAAGTGTAQTELYAMDATSGVGFTGDGATVDTYFTDLRLVPKSNPGSYVVTTSAAVTGATASANIDGAAEGTDDGSATVANGIITVDSGGAKGLKLFYSGFTFAESTQLDFTVGFGAQMYFAIDKMLDKTTGVVETEIGTLSDQNTVSQDRITEMLDRLEIQRKSLLERFIAMETALSTAQRVMDSIKQTTDALLGSKS